MHGIAGAGKTTLVATVIQALKLSLRSTYALAYFYCSYRDTGSHDPVEILGSLARQIAIQKEQSFEAIATFYRKFKEPYYEIPAKASPAELCALIRELSSYFQDVMILVDGLDEIATERANVTQILQNLTGNGCNIKMILASRLEEDLKWQLAGCDEVDIAATSTDLRIYVYSQIETRSRDFRFRTNNPDLKERVAETLIHKAQGMYVTISLRCVVMLLKLMPR